MKARNNIQGDLEEIVAVGLNCLEQKIESKEDVRRSILDYVGEHYIRFDSIEKVEDFPVKLLAILQAQLGIGFETNGGKVSRAVVEPSFGFVEIVTPPPRHPKCGHFISEELKTAQGGF